jgi:hypothetical protein
MKIGQLSTILKDNRVFAVPATLIGLIIIAGGFGVYLADNRPGANITKFGNSLWWAVVTIAFREKNEENRSIV